MYIYIEGAKGDFVDPIPFQNALLNNLDGQAKFWIGKDYTNFIIKDFVNLELPYAGNFFKLYADIILKSVGHRRME